MEIQKIINMKKLMLILVFTLVYKTGLFAQQNTAGDPIGKAFFSPELMMQNQQAINLTEAQRNNISKEMQNAQSEFMTLQWDLEKEAEKLKSLIEKEKPGETEVLEQLERMLVIENKIKKRQIALLIRLKNLISHEQQEKLQNLKDRGR
jgi:Spy/CpxP family protein refolding chaperone